MNLDRSAILQCLELYKTAVFEKNVDMFLSLYDLSSRVFDTWDVWIFDGVDSRRAIIESWFGSLGEECVKVNFSDVQLSASLDMAVLTAVGTYAAFSPDNKALRSMQNRVTWALKMQNGQWKIFHEHTSVPIADNLMAILSRDSPFYK